MTPPSERDLEKEMEREAKKFISGKHVLVADASAGVRSGAYKVLRELEAKYSHVVMAADFSSALAEAKRVAPQILVCEYRIGEHSGLELIEALKEKKQDPAQTLYILVTSDTSESVVAEAAEGDVDSYLVKPFNLATFREYLIRAAYAKQKPTPYQQAVTDARSFLTAGDPDKAIPKLEAAIALAPKPTLACYFLGQAHFVRKDFPKSEHSYIKGLKHNAVHYRCLVGLFDTYREEGKLAEAYKVAHRISRIFPLSAQKLDTFVRLAVKAEMYDHIEHYHQLYLGMDMRPPELTKVVQAGLIVAGHHYLQQGNWARAEVCLKKGWLVSFRNLAVLKEIVNLLLKYGQDKMADAFVADFPVEERGAPEFQILDYRVQDRIADKHRIVTTGRKLVAAGIYDPEVHAILIKRTAECGLKDTAEDLAIDAGLRWPERKSEYQQLAQTPSTK